MENSSQEIRKGLEGVIVDSTSISKVMPEINSLVYRGYRVQDLAERRSFEEVVYLLWNQDLPNRQQLLDFSEKERKERTLSKDLLQVIRLFPAGAHAMDSLRTAVSFLALEDSDVGSVDDAANRRMSLRLLAKIPTIIAAIYRLRSGQEAISPRSDLTISENFFHMCFGKVPAKEVVKAFDASLILYAEHGFNASTFTARVVASSLADMMGAVTAAIASLKGPLHGGANEQVMHMLKEIGEPAKAREWLLDALKTKKKVMGFGHRVYKNGDSRVPTMKKYAQQLAELGGQKKWMQISDILEQVMREEKGIYPNLDFPAGPAYGLMGFEIDLFTPIFVMSRISGWAAHVMEQHASNRLIRPLSTYTGPKERTLPS